MWHDHGTVPAGRPALASSARGAGGDGAGVLDDLHAANASAVTIAVIARPLWAVVTELLSF